MSGTAAIKIDFIARSPVPSALPALDRQDTFANRLIPIASRREPVVRSLRLYTIPGQSFVNFLNPLKNQPKDLVYSVTVCYLKNVLHRTVSRSSSIALTPRKSLLRWNNDLR